MKRIILLWGVIFIVSSNLNAQVSIKAGLQGGYTNVQSGMGGFGINGEFVFKTARIGIAPSITYFGKTVEGKGVLSLPKFKYLLDVNADLHYYFVNTNTVNVYGLVGPNFYFGNGSWDDEDFDQFFGVNTGAGVSVKAGKKIEPFLEGKYTFTQLKRFTLTGGIRFVFK